MTIDVRACEFALEWATCPKWATARESEAIGVVESLDGSLGVAMVDVQGSGSSGGRRLALDLTNFARNLLESGVGAGECAIATHQRLVALREGKVSASIHCIALDTARAIVTIAGFGQIFTAQSQDNDWVFESPGEGLAGTIGAKASQQWNRQLAAGDVMIVANDGIGDLAAMALWTDNHTMSATTILEQSHVADSGRPRSDKSVLVISVRPSQAQDRRRNGLLIVPALVRTR